MKYIQRCVAQKNLIMNIEEKYLIGMATKLFFYICIKSRTSGHIIYSDIFNYLQITDVIN